MLSLQNSTWQPLVSLVTTASLPNLPHHRIGLIDLSAASSRQIWRSGKPTRRARLFCEWLHLAAISFEEGASVLSQCCYSPPHLESLADLTWLSPANDYHHRSRRRWRVWACVCGWLCLLVPCCPDFSALNLVTIFSVSGISFRLSYTRDRCLKK